MSDATRRTFLQSSLLASAAFAVRTESAGAHVAAAPDMIDKAGRSLKILVLGGTGFLGPATVEYAMARGHEITLFNRGRTNSDLFPGLEKLRGDRDPDKGDGLSAIEAEIAKGRRWDAVIDTSCYYPRISRSSATLLADHSDLYVIISSISVYDDFSVRDLDENGAVGTMEDPTIEDMGPGFQYYGPLKALSEEAAEAAMPGRTCRIRPGLIVGPRDGSDRFNYWPIRVSQGGEILAPGSPDDPTQIIDVRDLGEFMVRCCENKTAGIFNATGPVYPTNMAEMLYGCKAVTGGDAHFTWVPADFLGEHGVGAWMNMPAWVDANGDSAGLMQVNIDRAIEAGLTTRPLAETVAATIDWFRSLPEDRQAMLGPDAVGATAENSQDESIVKRRAGISRAKETEVLAAWHSRKG